MTLREVGDCVMTRLADGRLHIDRADPCILIGDEFFRSLITDSIVGWDISVVGQTQAGSRTGALLKIFGTNRTVVYRIGERAHDRFEPWAYYAEWPD